MHWLTYLEIQQNVQPRWSFWCAMTCCWRKPSYAVISTYLFLMYCMCVCVMVCPSETWLSTCVTTVNAVTHRPYYPLSWSLIISWPARSTSPRFMSHHLTISAAQMYHVCVIITVHSTSSPQQVFFNLTLCRRRGVTKYYGLFYYVLSQFPLVILESAKSGVKQDHGI